MFSRLYNLKIMDKIIVLYLFPVFICLVGSRLYAQETPLTAGGTISGTGGTVSFSVGQVAYITHVGINGSEVQGVQQPYEISVITAEESSSLVKLSILVYPNPTEDLLVLKNEGGKHTELTFQLYNSKGQQINSGTINSDRYILEMRNTAPGVYYLSVFEENKLAQIVKIIKK